MVLLVVTYLGGVLTILSPCILPILPFTFARADRPFRSNGLPLLLSMAVTFAAIATLTVVGGGWLVRANQLGRYVAVTGQRLYQLIRQQGAVRDRTFTIEFLDGGAQAFSFTFG